MDTAVASAVTTSLTTLKTDTLSNFVVVIPIAFAVIISVAVARWMIKHFRSMVHV